MRKILSPVAVLLVAAIIVYAILLNGFDVFVATGIVMITVAMVITFKIVGAKAKTSE